MQANFNQIMFGDSDVANPSEFIPAGQYNPHRIRPWLLHDAGSVVAVVFAGSLQDALDIAADERKLDAFRVSEKELPDYGSDGEGLSYLGNACEPYDIQMLDAIELPNPPFSFVALFNSLKEKSQR